MCKYIDGYMVLYITPPHLYIHNGIYYAEHISKRYITMSSIRYHSPSAIGAEKCVCDTNTHLAVWTKQTEGGSIIGSPTSEQNFGQTHVKFDDEYRRL